MAKMWLISCIVFLSLTLVFIASFVACLVLQYYIPSVWCFFTGVAFAISSNVAYLAYSNRLDSWYGDRQLEELYRLGASISLFGMVGIIYHSVFYGMSAHYGQFVEFHIVFIALVSSVMTIIAGACLVFSVQKYRTRTNEAPLIEN